MRTPIKYLLAFLLIILLFASIYLLLTLRQSEEDIAFEFIAEPDHRAVILNDEPSHDESIRHDTIEFPTLNQVTTNEVERIRNKQHLKDVLDSPNKLAEFNFDACDMSTCFDFTRCNDNDTLRVYIAPGNDEKVNIALNITGESNIIHDRILRIIRQSKYYEPDPNKACLFVPADDTLDRDPLSTSFRRSYIDLFNSEHRFGMNYLIFNLYSGTWPDYKENDFSGFRIGAAILAKASNSLEFHRNKFDISIPLFSYSHPEADEDSVDNSAGIIDEQDFIANKTFLLTFKGKRYVIGSGSEIRNSLYHLSNQRDVIMLTTCRHGKKWREVEDARCSEDDVTYKKYDFNELMRNSIFCLTPRGRRLGSFRFLEALNSTCIPVILGDGWVWPFEELIDWTKAAVRFPSSDIFLVPDTLRDFDSHRIKSMQMECRRLYWKYFASTEKIVMTTIEIIEQRVKREIKRQHF